MSRQESMPQATPIAPFHVMVKPAGPACQLRCTYCFYISKLEEMSTKGAPLMNEEVLEAYIRSYCQANPAPELVFAWQGGEPTLRGLDFFRKAVRLQRQYAGGRKVLNAFQTNGMLLSDEWGRFMADEGFLVGISVDGPENIHNTYRRDRSGHGSFRAVMRGLEVLQKFKVEYNTLTTVHPGNQDKALEVYRFLRGLGARYLQFIPIVEVEAKEGGSPKVSRWSVNPAALGRFMIELFDRWLEKDTQRYSIQWFDTFLLRFMGAPGGVCVHSEECGRAVAMEHDGTVYACDHYVFESHKRGSVLEDSWATIIDSPAQKQFGRDKWATLPRQCRECRWRFACNGGCPKHRVAKDRYGETGLNYLCPAYFSFLEHAAPGFSRIASQMARAGSI